MARDSHPGLAQRLSTRTEVPRPRPKQATEPYPVRRWSGPPNKLWRRPPPRRSNSRALLALVLAVVVVAAGVAIAALTWTTKSIDDSVARVPGAFPTGDRPAPAPGMTFLVVGRDPQSQTDADSVADSVMMFHVSEGRRQAQMVSLPVHPLLADGSPGLETVYGSGGASALVHAVEKMSGLRVDHYVEVDFAGFASATDALGGINIDVPEPFTAGGYDIQPGRQHFDGAAALAYLRDDGVGGELGTAQRQQILLTALFQRVTQLGLFSNLGRLTTALGKMATAVRVDDTLGGTDLVQLVWSLRRLKEPAFVSAPLDVPAVQDATHTATYDPASTAKLWSYLRKDTLAKHLDEFR